MTLSAQVAILVCTAGCAGTVDAIAGGGGLLTVPALLAVGLPPHLVLGTNKGQSVFGASASLTRYARAGMIDGRRARWIMPAGFLGSLCGVSLTLLLKPEWLRPIILCLLVAAGLFVAFRPVPKQVARLSWESARWVAVCVALAIGAYDGFFGPGTGTFLIVAFVALLGLPLAKASAEAKVVNFASNLAAFSMFATRGLIVWHFALPMAAAQLAGGWLGAHLAVRKGDALVRRVVLLVVLVLAAKLARDLYVHA